jgi:hypothetical protein
MNGACKARESPPFLRSLRHEVTGVLCAGDNVRSESGFRSCCRAAASPGRHGRSDLELSCSARVEALSGLHLPPRASTFRARSVLPIALLFDLDRSRVQRRAIPIFGAPHPRKPAVSRCRPSTPSRHERTPGKEPSVFRWPLSMTAAENRVASAIGCEVAAPMLLV